MTLSLALRILAAWIAVSVPVSLAAAAWLHAGSGDEDLS